MYPVTTFIRHKGIAAALAVSRIIYTVTKGRHPAFLFSGQIKTKDIGTGVRVTERDKTSVTIAKYAADGKIDGGEFRIMTGTDFHMDPGNEALNNKTIKNFVRAIEEYRPDLVVLTGDIILSDCQQTDAVQFSQMMERLGVYWCYVFGNHEAREEKEYFKYFLYKGLMYCPHCLNLFGDPALFGYGNFAVNILESENTLKKTLFLFDSGRDIQEKVKKELNIPSELNGYDFIKPGQINWYLNELKKIKARYGDTKTLCYMHIPIPEYKEVFDGNEKDGYTPSEKTELLYGSQYESIGCSPYNSGFFDAALKEGSIQAFYAGHDHINDFCAVYKGVYLVYSQCCGYNTYSMLDRGFDEKDCHFGVTLTTLLPGGEIKAEQKKHSAFLK